MENVRQFIENCKILDYSYECIECEENFLLHEGKNCQMIIEFFPEFEFENESGLYSLNFKANASEILQIMSKDTLVYIWKLKGFLLSILKPNPMNLTDLPPYRI